MAEPQYIGPYRIVRQLGAGGMGAVYEAIHSSISRRVALKVLHASVAQTPELITRFFNEARAVNLIEHPGIVQVSDYGQTEQGQPYLIMEFLNGEPLSKRLHKGADPLTVADVIRLTRQLAEALTAAHDCGIVHRDLKPENVMLVKDIEVDGGIRTKLIDFGIAKLAPQHQGEQALGFETAIGTLMGTPVYMAPEQCRGAGDVGAAADVYALGTIVYHLLAGTPPFVASSVGELLAMKLYDPLEPLSTRNTELPPELSALVDNMLQRLPGERPTMRQVLQRLKELPLPTLRELQAASSVSAASSASLMRSTLGRGEHHGHTLRASRLVLSTAVLLAVLTAAVWTARSLTAVPQSMLSPTSPVKTAAAGIPPAPVQTHVSEVLTEIPDLAAPTLDAAIAAAPDSEISDPKRKTKRSPRHKKDIVNDQVRYVE